MIRHFIVQDFRSDRILWILLLLVLLISAPFVYYDAQALQIPAFAAFFFAITGVNKIAGSNFRNQHQMSRNYLLALPLSRDFIYRILNYRLFAYAAPFGLCAILFPLSLRDPTPDPFRYLLYLASLPAVGIWIANAMIRTQIAMEKSMALTTSLRRGLSFVKVFGFMMIESTFCVLAVGSMLESSFRFAPFFMPVFYVGAFFAYRSGRKKWVGV